MTQAPVWVVEALVTLNIATITAFGGFVIHQWRKSRTENTQQVESVQAQLRVQGRLLNELVYSYTHLTEQLDKELDTNVRTDRVERLHELAADGETRWGEDDD